MFFVVFPFGMRAQSAGGTVRELAKQIIATTGTRDDITLSFRNISKMGAAEAAAVRQSLVNELRARGARVAGRPGAFDVQVTLSANAAQHLLIVETHGRVILLPFDADLISARSAATALSIQKIPILEQREQILDLAIAGQNLLLLQPSRISLYTARNGRWDSLQSLPLPTKFWPRDLRGLLRVEGGSFQAYLPGLVCSGAMQPSFESNCREEDEPWPVPLQARFAAGRNYFDGRILTSSGEAKTLPPFFAVAAAGTGWVFSGLDGRLALYNQSLNPAGNLAGWGSDIAGISPACAGGSGPPVLATLPASGQERDAVQAFAIVDREPVPMSAAVEFPGPVTALWASGADSATVVSRDPVSGKYAAYTLAISCRN